MSRILMLACIVSAAAGLLSAAHAGPLAGLLLDQQREVALARSGAQAAVSGKAGVFVLREDGYQQIERSSNGFNCLVLRSIITPGGEPSGVFDPKIVGPICYNAEASRSVLQRDLQITRLVAQGKSAEDIKREIEEAYNSGRLRAPDRPAIAYMFSSAQFLGPRIGHWHPHVMIWSPNLTNADTGGFSLDAGLPIVDSSGGPRQSLIVIPVSTFVDPSF